MDASLPDPPEASVDAAAATDASSEAGSDAGSDGGSSRDGGASDAGPPGDITVENSAFVGKFLADINGRSLYIYASDTPGDCEQPAVSVCEADCALSWPIFDAKKRRLSPGLDDSLFGDIVRADGTHQTTYRGWPLYYYKTDTVRGMVTGQNKGTAWWLATVTPPNITIMKTGTQKRLSDYAGYTLYAYDQDHKGDEASSPESACGGACSAQYPPVLLNHVSAVSSLSVNDFTLFARKGTARLQLAYKGSPLYYSASDARPGQINGAPPDSGWSIVAP
jgi:predicted lipoprotein with Yx(FWY)xxD motif